MPKAIIPTSVTRIQTKKARSALNALPELNCELLKRGIEDWNETEVADLFNDFLKYMLNDSVVWHKNYFAKRGLTWNEVKRLAKRFPFVAKAVEIAELILEGRYVEIPFHKNTTSKHCAILLREGLANPWITKMDVNVEHTHRDIFAEIKAEPIIEIKEEEASKIINMARHGTQSRLEAERAIGMDVVDNE